MKLMLRALVLVGCGIYGLGFQALIKSQHSRNAHLANLLSVQRDNDKGLDTGSPYDCERGGGIAFCDRCLFVPLLNSTRDVGYDDAIAACEAGGGSLAEIHDWKEQLSLGDQLQPKMPEGRTFVYLWIGMQYKNETSTLQYRSGKELPTDTFQWYQYYPNGTHPQVMAKVYDVTNFYALLWNQPRSLKMHGVVCEKKLWLQ